MLHQITYDRQKRQWTASNGPVSATFPPGPAGKARATMYALEHDCPVVYEEVVAIIENNRLHPETNAIEARALNAGLLVRDGHVLAPDGWYADQLNAYATVKSQRDAARRYHIYPGWDDLACTCEDYKFRAPFLHFGRACKHILAYLIACQVAEVENEMAEIEADLVKA